MGRRTLGVNWFPWARRADLVWTADRIPGQPITQYDLRRRLGQVKRDQGVVAFEGRPGEQARKRTHSGRCVRGSREVPITGTHPDLHPIQAAAVLLYEQLSHDMLWYLMRSCSQVFEPRELLA